MPYRLLALDVDGTIVGPDLTIPPVLKEAVAEAQARGVHVTLATGRTYKTTLPFAQELAIDDAIICYQGALIRHAVTGEVFTQFTMPPELAAEAVRAVLDDNLFVIAFIDERSYIVEERSEFQRYLDLHPEGVDAVIEPRLAELVAEVPPAKLLFVAEPTVVEAALAELAARFAGRLNAMRSHTYFGELTPLGVSKGAALAALAGRLGIRREQVLAIGDQENDLPMIAWAGLGLAMGNATPAVQAAAAAVIPPVEEAGVALAIRRYVLDGPAQVDGDGQVEGFARP